MRIQIRKIQWAAISLVILISACGHGETMSGFSTLSSPDVLSDNAVGDFKQANEESKTTFSIDVDTASYSITRSTIEGGQLPAIDSVRLEEFINYFDYSYDEPELGFAFAVHTEVGSATWNNDNRLLKIGIKGKTINAEERGNSNLVFLIDTSGSMSQQNKLPLLKKSLNALVDQLTIDDHIAIVTYAGTSGVALDSTTGDQKDKIKQAIDSLISQGSTNGESGINLAYSLASANFQSEGINRVILATDGDFNVGQTNPDALVELIKSKAEGGIFLTALGFGLYSNDYTMEKLADNGNGNYAYIDSLNEAKKALVDNINGTLITIAKDVKIQVNFDPAVVAQYRLLGYKNRILNNEDFEDDSKDAGDIGAGHTVTAFYEVVLQPNIVAASDVEIASLSLRYKQPNEEISELIEATISDGGDVSEDFLFAAAVAEFALILEDSAYKGNASYDSVLTLSETNKGADLRGYRQGFIDLVNKAKLLE